MLQPRSCWYHRAADALGALKTLLVGERGAGRAWDALDLKTSPRNPDVCTTVTEQFVF